MGAHDEGPYAAAVRVRPVPHPRRRPLRWAVAAAVVVLCSVTATSEAGADGARPSNFESGIDSIDPDLDQVTVEIVGGDAFVQVTATQGTEVLVPGYDGEPYLRIDDRGVVYRNRRSSATYITQDRYGTAAELPGSVDSSAAPDWERIGDGGQVAWHDHRIHWMLDNAPETSDGVVQPWTLPLTVDGTEVEVSGRLLLRADQFPWPALIGVAVAGLAAWRSRRELTRSLLLAGAATVALVSSVSWYVANPPGATPTVLPIVLPALALVAVLVARATPPVVRHLVLPLAAVAALAGWFVQRVGVLWMPTIPTPLPDALERVVGATVIGIAVGVAIAVVMRPYPQDAPDQGASTARSSGSQSSTPPRS
jgi:hypothetical protein